jgi:coatomer subunit beta
MEFLGEAGNASAVDVIAFVREVVEKFPDLRSSIVEKLLETFADIKSGKVFRGALWIVGEYCTSVEGASASHGASRATETSRTDMKETLQQIRKVLGEIPILASEQVHTIARVSEPPILIANAQRLLDQAEADAQLSSEATPTANVPRTTTKVLADGTYATETVYSSSSAAKLEAVKAASKPPLRSLILGGDFYTAAVLSSTLTKLILRFSEQSKDERAVNELRAEVRTPSRAARPRVPSLPHRAC